MLAQVHAQIASGKLLSALARLLSDGDLLLRVRSPAINQARTLEEAAAEIERTTWAWRNPPRKFWRCIGRWRFV